MNTFLADFKAYLESELTLGTFTIAMTRMNENPSQDNVNMIVLSNKVNPAPITTLEEVTNQVKRLQILVRSDDDDLGEAMCSDIVSAMNELWQGHVAATTSYLSVAPIQSEFAYLGDDENHRPLWSCNWEMIVC